MKRDLKKAFENLVAQSTPGEVRRLREELLSGEVLRCRYSDDLGHGCVLNILTSGIANSRQTRRQWYATFGEEVLAASDDIVAAWDNRQLSPEMLLAWLDDVKPSATPPESFIAAEVDVETAAALAM